MNKKQLAIAGGLVVLLAAGVILSDNGGGSGTTVPEITAAEMVMEPAAPETARETTPAETKPEPKVCAISPAEQTIMDALWDCLVQEDDEGAARVLSDNEGQLQILFYTTLEAGDWLYDGERMIDDLNGTGLVFRRPTTVYYGELKDGCPEGAGTVLQAIRVHAGRYDYAKGNWQDGKLEGVGISGHRYYEEPAEDELLEVKKEGTFHQNLMDGPVVYTSVNRDGETSRWEFTAENGVTVLDEAWNFAEDKGEYRLFTEGDDTHAYILAEDEIGIALWKNQATWE